jgi:MFS family permease
MTYWGPLSDKFGNYRILVVTAFAVPFSHLGWTFFRNFYLLIFLQLFAGFTMAGFNLAQSNFIFDAVRRENVSKIMGYFNMLNTLMIFLGSVAGGIIYEMYAALKLNSWVFNPYTLVFITSSVLRFIVVFSFRKSFREVRHCEPSPPTSYFLIEKPAQDVLDAIQLMNLKVFQIPFQPKKPKQKD